jgi:hypothetical protein
LYSRYPVDQYDPEKTIKEIKEQQRDELDWMYNPDILIETEKTMTVEQLDEQVTYVSNTINELNKQIENAKSNYKLKKRLEQSNTYLLKWLNRLNKLIKEKLEEETARKKVEETNRKKVEETRKNV